MESSLSNPVPEEAHVLSEEALTAGALANGDVDDSIPESEPTLTIVTDSENTSAVTSNTALVTPENQEEAEAEASSAVDDVPQCDDACLNDQETREHEVLDDAENTPLLHETVPEPHERVAEDQVIQEHAALDATENTPLQREPVPETLETVPEQQELVPEKQELVPEQHEPPVEPPVSHFPLAQQVFPGIGKVFALPSMLACDVDAFVDTRTYKTCDECLADDDDDEDDFGVYPYPSNVTTSTGYSEDLEANGSSPTNSRDSGLGGNPPLDTNTDPFAARVGKTLLWKNVNMTLEMEKDQPHKKLLNNVWGEVPQTETTAIMGASGAGKTSLLNILAGRARSNGRLKIEADVRLNNYTVDPTSIKVRKSIAFVAQDDSLQSTATPREAIRFSAKLRLPRSTTDAQLDLLTTRMLQELGLTACADTIVGGPLIKGISGGERKRTSVGVELVVQPSMVFLDEPTSGLDSFSAVQVCQVLKKVAHSGASVLFTIHQPSSEIFSSFDRLILLHKGRVLFQGAVSSVPSYFAARGYGLPDHYNPADWVVNVAQKYPIPVLEQAGFFPKDERIISDPTVPKKGQDFLGNPIVNRLASMQSGTHADEPPGLGVQVDMLFKRELVYMYRFPLPLYTRFGLTAFLGLLIGMIFFDVGAADASDNFNLTSQFGALMILLMLALLGTAQPALLYFPEERPIFLREFSTDHYSSMSYFISRLFVEAVNTGVQVFIMVTLIYHMVNFQGSVAMYYATTYALAMSGTAMAVMLGVLSGGNAKVAQQLIPLIFIPQLLFSGFFVSPNLIPKFLRWAQYVCVLTYAVRMLIVEEFHNCDDKNYFANQNCNMLVDKMEAVPGDEWFYWTMLVAYFFCFRTLALLLLRKSATRFY